MLQTVLKYCVSSKDEVTQVFNSTCILLEKNNIFNWAFKKWPGFYKGRFLALLEMKTI